MKYRVIRPDGSPVNHTPEISMLFAAWAAAEVDEEIAKRIRKNSTANVGNLKRIGYVFEEVED